jgi:hypothetical protein
MLTLVEGAEGWSLMTGLRRSTKEEGATGSVAQVWEVEMAMWVQTSLCRDENVDMFYGAEDSPSSRIIRVGSIVELAVVVGGISRVVYLR